MSCRVSKQPFFTVKLLFHFNDHAMGALAEKVNFTVGCCDQPPHNHGNRNSIPVLCGGPVLRFLFLTATS